MHTTVKYFIPGDPTGHKGFQCYRKYSAMACKMCGSNATVKSNSDHKKELLQCLKGDEISHVSVILQITANDCNNMNMAFVRVPRHLKVTIKLYDSLF
jgi:hypothetical protein